MTSATEILQLKHDKGAQQPNANANSASLYFVLALKNCERPRLE